jgi:putative hydrolase
MIQKRKFRKVEFPRFNDLTTDNANFDYHVHTNWTDGTDTVGELLIRATEIGLHRIAFTEHVRSDTEWFGDFVSEIIKEKKSFPHLHVLIGCETKSLNKDGMIDVSEEILDSCDIVLGSVHRFPDGNGSFIKTDSLSKIEFSQIEFELAMGLLKHAPIDVLAHPGGMYFRSFSDFPQSYMRKLLEESIERKIAVEINSAYIADFGAMYALYKDINPYVSIGSDVHVREILGNCYKKLVDHIKGI